MSFKTPTLYQYLLALSFSFTVTPVLSCGWWGDGEKSSENATFVRLSNYPHLEPHHLADADYLTNLGNQYRSTGYKNHSYSWAIHFYQLAAELDHSGAQYNLGMMYEMGLGVNVDRNRAAGWYKLAAEKGNVHAQHHLGELYISGNGAERNLERGLDWLLLAAKSGHSEIFARIASLYWEKKPVVDFHLHTAFWSTLAIENGDRTSNSLLTNSRQLLTAKEFTQLENLLINFKQATLVTYD